MAYLRNTGKNEYVVISPAGKAQPIAPGGVADVEPQEGQLKRIQRCHDSGVGHQLALVAEGFDSGTHIETGDPTSTDPVDLTDEQEAERASAATTLLERADEMDWNDFRADAIVILGEGAPAKKADLMEALSALVPVSDEDEDEDEDE